MREAVEERRSSMSTTPLTVRRRAPSGSILHGDAEKLEFRRRFGEGEILLERGTLHRNVRPVGVSVPLITLTATCPPKISDRIGSSYGMKNWEVVRQETSRRNLRYAVRDVREENLCRELDKELCRLYEAYNSCSFRAIVYVPTRKGCEQLCVTLSVLTPEIPCFKYHGGMEPMDRKEVQKDWRYDSDGKGHLMVATSAFGCGIDITTVRVVIHAATQKNLTEYIQESGRAGRDGKPACLVFYTAGGELRTTSQGDRPFEPDSDPQQLQISSVNGWEEAMFGNVDGLTENSGDCRRWLLDRFVDGNVARKSCDECDMERCDVCTSKESPVGGLPMDAAAEEGGAKESFRREDSLRK